jgi:hypothetical protein
MAERRPLVIVGEEMQELPAGDTLPGIGGSAPYELKTASFTVVAHGRYRLGANGITATLPAAPGGGEPVWFVPAATGMTGLVVARNGKPIVGIAEDMTIDRDIGFGLVFEDDTNGWRLI